MFIFIFDCRRLQECKEKREKELEQLEKKLREKQGIKEPPKLSSDEIDRFISRYVRSKRPGIVTLSEFILAEQNLFIFQASGGFAEARR